MSKADFLNPKWQKFRLERLELANWSCDACGGTKDTLHVHHPFYISGRKPWQYPLQITQVLCDECHEISHEFSADYDGIGPDKWELVLEKAFKWNKSVVGAFQYIDKAIDREFTHTS